MLTGTVKLCGTSVFRNIRDWRECTFTNALHMCAHAHVTPGIDAHVPCVCDSAFISIPTHTCDITVKIYVLILWFCTDSAFASTIDCKDPKRSKKYSICAHVNKSSHYYIITVLFIVGRYSPNVHSLRNGSSLNSYGSIVVHTCDLIRAITGWSKLSQYSFLP